MFSDFVSKKMREANYKLLKDGTYFGEIPGIKGVWANSKSLEDCREELQEVFEDWLVLKIRVGERVSGFALPPNHRVLEHA